jgi:hypothetical protein
MPAEADEQAIRAFLARSGADWLVADCEASRIERLREMDHHVVTVDGKPGVLVTYHLWTEPLPHPPRVFVLFQYADRHPRAPADVQRTVETLTFRGA